MFPLKNSKNPTTWPFAIWGLDLIGKLLPTPGGFDHLFVMINKFTKWIEAKPIAIARLEAAVEFIKEVIHQYGVIIQSLQTMTPNSPKACLSISMMNIISM
jgi:hypothetical protein